MKINNYNFFQNRRKFFKKRNRINTPAKLIDKKLDFDKKDSSYILIFELYTGVKLTFYVNSYIYSEIFIGDKGILTYEKGRLINFKKKY